jgi:hypothetical protein
MDLPRNITLENDQIVQRLLWTIFMLYKYVERVELDIFYSDIALPAALGYILELPRLKILLVESAIEHQADLRSPYASTRGA